MNSLSMIERFWSKVNKNGPIQSHIGGISRCWEWVGAYSQAGYGKFAVKLPDMVYGNRLAHRVSWFIHFGSFPKEVCVLHKCDNPCCINPDHLFLGTRSDNNWDCVLKKRNVNSTHPELLPRGSKHGNSKLSENQVINIRTETGKTQRSIAEKYGVSQSVISCIKNGKGWAHISDGRLS